MTKLSGTIVALLLTTSAMTAQQCSQATLNGTYVNSGTGSLGGVAVVTLGKVTYDGHGAGQSSFTTSTAGVISRSTAVPGVYTVKPDCTGSKTFGGTTDYDFVVTPDGRDIYWIVTNTNSGALLQGHAVRMDTSAALHVTKDCSAYTGAAGGFCTITSSNLAAIKVGSKVFYNQAAGVPPGLLDSDVVLDAGNGNRAFGHCTVDSNTGLGLCTYSSGTGQLAGFRARVDVSPLAGAANNFRWDGTYSFNPEALQ